MPTYTLITSQTITTTTFSITSIPQTYKHLRLVIKGIGAGWNGLRVNSVSTADYDNGCLAVATGGYTTNGYTNYTGMAFSGQSSLNTSFHGMLVVDFFDYTGSVGERVAKSRWLGSNSTSSSQSFEIWTHKIPHGSAITSIQNVNGAAGEMSFSNPSFVELYGIE